ncbi:cytochrome P450 [Streptomyces avermitilis]
MLRAARDSEGRSLGDRELEDQVISLNVVGYETTSAAMGWTVDAALHSPGVWDDARKKVDSVLGDAELTGDALERLPCVDAVVQEALRFHPPVVVLPRVSRRRTSSSPATPSGPAAVSPSAAAELKTILIELLRRTELRLEGKVTRPASWPCGRRRGVPVVVRRRT